MQRLVLTAVLAATLMSNAALAEITTLPALHHVTGVAVGDVLNIRQAPSAAAAIIGTLPPDAEGIEVIAVQNGWAQVNAGEGAGFVKMTYLAAAPGPGWHQLSSPISCFGTEPFWGISVNPQTMQAEFSSPDASDVMIFRQVWPGSDLPQPVAVDMDKAILVMSGAACNDGMSDRAFGISASLFLRGPGQAALHGCCSIAP